MYQPFFIHIEQFYCPEILCVLRVPPSPRPRVPATAYLLTVSIALPFPECHGAGILQHTVYSDWLLPLVYAFLFS